MATITLKHLVRDVDRHGNARHYFRVPGRPKVRLHGEPGSRAFLDAYAAALEAMGSERPSAGAAPRPGSISALCVAYYQSADYKALADQTRYTYRQLLDKFRATYGDGSAGKLTAPQISAILDKSAHTPAQAKNLLKTLRALFRFAAARGMVRSNPAMAVTFKVRKTAGYRAWTDADIEAFETHWPSGSRARLAIALLLYTGQRRSDVVRMGRQHVSDGAITVRQLKRGPDAPMLTIPIHANLKAELDRLPAGQMIFLMTAFGKPMSPFGFSNWFADCAKKAGLPEHSSPHGLRKAAARRLAEAGCSTLEIMSITGHASMREVERYTASVSQKRLAEAGMGKIANR
ncbi:MAG: tyrosine-type recombinase/integrase [Minisyncoccia bacterium]